jgi:ribonuclease R
LVVHRLIKHLLAGGTAADLDYTKTELQQAAEWCSGTERRADEATRDAEDWLKCEFMQDKLGEKFDGTITSVNSFGIFVELDAVHVDGLVHITALDNDFYHFDPIGHRLQGERTGTVYRLGDRLRVQVAAVNLDERKIDFVLAIGPTAKSGRRGAKPAAAPPLTDAKPKSQAKSKPKSKPKPQRNSPSAASAGEATQSNGKPTPSAAKKARTRANKRKRSASNPVNHDD